MKKIRNRPIGSGRRFSDSQIRAAVADINSGKNQRSVSRLHGISTVTIQKRAKQLGLTIRKGQPPARINQLRLKLPQDPFEIGYLAGIIDGEGSIHRNGPGWNVDIANNDPGLHHWLLGIGGSITSRQGACLHWRALSRIDVLALLELVHPYLRVKKERAEEAISEIRSSLEISP